MADTKLSALAAATPVFADKVYGANDLAGTPTSKGFLLSTLPNLLASKTFISGLQMQWVSASAITIGIGAAYVESLGYPLAVTSAVAMTVANSKINGGSALSNSTWYYAYLRSDGDCEMISTAPAAPYAGMARSKTADTTRRFLGAAVTDASGNLYRFYHNTTRGLFRYQAGNLGAAPFRFMSNESGTSSTQKSAALVVPPQSRSAFGFIQNLNASFALYLSSGDVTVSSTLFDAALGAGGTIKLMDEIPLDTSQQVSYIVGGAGGGAYFDIYGYYLER